MLQEEWRAERKNNNRNEQELWTKCASILAEFLYFKGELRCMVGYNTNGPIYDAFDTINGLI